MSEEFNVNKIKLIEEAIQRLNDNSEHLQIQVNELNKEDRILSEALHINNGSIGQLLEVIEELKANLKQSVEACRNGGET